MIKQRIKISLLVALLVAITPVLWAAEINAVLDWSDLRKLGTTVSGKVSKVMARPGMKVKKDEPLLVLDQRTFSVRVQQARAAMDHARLLMEEAQREQDRAIELYDRTVISDYERQQADIGLASAKAVFTKAKADYEQARLDKEYSQLNSPYDAVVLNVYVAPGEVVVNQTESRVMLEIARADEMLVTTLLDGNQIASLQMGQKIDVAFRGQWAEGEIHSLSMSDKGYLLAVKVSVQSSD
ncbi:MAG: HlyD family efflux transporter periplasmic adaptor subunit, partial [Gammaproteobacteria bacterium]|nr:HlyD family efflux transporter periplasmic adaptor subunit [Gammaproteobacteria bacterium]